MFRKIIMFLVGMFLTLFSTLATPATVGPWSLSNPTAIGGSILYDGVKGKITSSVLITPNAPQVAKVLVGGGAGFALSFAVEQLLGAVDWVMDPANNQIKYIDPNKTCATRCQYRIKYLTSNTPEGACRAHQALVNLSVKQHSQYASLKLTRDGEETSMHGLGHCSGYIYMDDGTMAQSYAVRVYYDRTAQIERDNLSLETVAQQIIENAQNTNVSAQLAILEATNAMLIEAQQDEAKAEPIVNTLENNAKCPSGIVRNGSCWICDKSSFIPITRATRDAKTATRGKSCKNVTDTSIKSINANLFRNLIKAREQENSCWLPPDPNHILRLSEDKIALSHCEN